jgi:hypothetical protein
MTASWTRKAVMERLEEAIRLVHCTAGRVGPRGYGTSMPEHEYSALDLWYQAMQSAAELEAGRKARNRPRVGATADEITLADEALRWPAQFVKYEDRRRALALWLRSRAEGVSFKGLIVHSGLAHRTVIRHRDEAIEAIIDGLNGTSRASRNQLETS